MQVRLLGPVDVMAGGKPRPVHGLRRKAVLAALALHGGEIVSTGRLVDVVWGAATPHDGGEHAAKPYVASAGGAGQQGGDRGAAAGLCAGSR